MVWAIDSLSQIAPVDVVIVKGNHDAERSFYLGDSLYCWYDKNKNVNINNSPKSRKYYKWGINLIGFTHCQDEKPSSLPMLMANERSQDFADTKIHEWHCGHIHTSKKIEFKSMDEIDGVMIRFISSMSGADAWHYSKGFVANRRTGEAFLWDYENGEYAHFPTNRIIK
jgi:hypothetical protein